MLPVSPPPCNPETQIRTNSPPLPGPSGTIYVSRAALAPGSPSPNNSAASASPQAVQPCPRDPPTETLDTLPSPSHPPAVMSASDSITFGPKPDGEKTDETAVFCPKFDANGLLAAVAIDATTKEPLMLAWMNEESLRRTLELGEAVYYSRSRQELWHKGATSGHTQTIREIRTDCDQDALILYVDQKGAGACHTNRRSCFYRQLTPGTPTTLKFLD